MKFLWTTIYVNNLEESIAFYSNGFAVDSVNAMLDTVKSQNISVHSGPFETPGSTFFIIKDPNGLNIQFFQQK